MNIKIQSINQLRTIKKTNAMRKSFTRLFSIFILSMVISLQGFAQVFPVLGPTGDITNLKTTDSVVLTASEAVEAGTGVVRLKEGGNTLTAFQATNSKVTITVKEDGTSEISLDFTDLLEEEKAYTLEVDANFIKAVDDAAPNTAIASKAVKVGDWTAPVLATTDPFSPENGETEAIQLDADLEVAFNEDIAILADAKVFIYEDNGTAHGDLYDVVEVAGLSISGGKTLVIDTNKDFEELTTYYVVVTNAVVDDATDVHTMNNVNKFAGWLDNATWTFTTRDATAPEVTSTTIDNLGSTSFDVVLQLDKPGKVYVLAVEKGDTPADTDFTTGKGMVSKEVAAAATNVSVSLTEWFNVGGVKANMVEGGEYDVWVMTENAETVSPTKSAPEEVKSVMTLDVTLPTVTDRWPLDGASASTVNEEDYIKLELSEDIEVGTGAFDIYTWDSGTNHTLLVSVSAADCKVSLKTESIPTKNDSLYIPVDKTLWESTGTYFVKYNEGVVADPTGNKLVAETSTENWKFTVQDFVAPTYTIVPTDGTDNASQVAPQVIITFNEAVYKTNTATAMDDAGIQAAITLKTGTTAVTYATTGSTSTVLKLTIDAAKVESNAAFELSIDTKKIWDAVGNAGTTVDKVNFTLKDYEAPTVDVKPDGPAPSANIIVEFDEKVFNADGSEITDADVANIVIFRKGTDATGAIVNAAYSVAADGESFIINPDNDLVDLADYFVKVGAGAVEDAAENANAAYDEVITVADVVAPTATFSVTATDPIDPPTTVTFSFSEAMATLDGVAVAGTNDGTALVNLKEDGENFLFTAAWANTTDLVVTAAFANGKTYTVAVGKSVEDLSDNVFAGISKTFSTWSDVAPAKASVAPAADATEQANDVAVSVTFDQIISKTGAGTVTIVDSGATPVTGVTTTVDGATLKIAHDDLVVNETYTVTVSTGYVENDNSDGNTAVVTWDFKTEDTVKPTVGTYDPSNGAAGVAVDKKPVLTFSEKVVLKTGSIFIKDFATDITVMTLTEANAEVKSDDELHITPTANFDYSKKYYVEITEGLVEDVNANKYVGITGNATWVFTAAATPGTFTVKVDDGSPADTEDKVAADLTTITVVFNRDIKAGSLASDENVSLTGAGVGLVFDDAANTGRFSISGNTLIIQTLGDLVADETYTLAIDGGIATDAWDTDNGSATITFYTFDNYAPEVVSHTPAKDAEDVAVNTTITLAWDETPFNSSDASAISASDIKTNAIVSIDNGVGTDYTAVINGNEWVLTIDAPPSPLTEKTIYTVTVDVSDVEDADGNTGGTTDYTWSFTVEDKTVNAPTAFVVTENTAGTKIKFTVDFDEKGDVYYVVQPSADAAPDAAAIMAADMKIAFAGTGTSAATEVTGLTSGAKYKAYLVAKDEAGNVSTVYTPAEITPADVVKPTLVSMTPANEATEIAANTTLVLNFDEALKPATFAGKVIVREVDTDIIVASFNVDGNVVLSNDDETATIDGSLSLANETAYYVEISAGAFVDVAGNAWVGISGAANWSFTTKDIVAPTIEETSPDYTETTPPEITADETIWVEFDEAMKVPTGVVYVKYDASGDVFEVVNAADITMSEDMMTMSFNLTNVPTEETEFYVDLVDLVLKDEADNAWSNIFTGGTLKDWDFIILDQTAPALASSVPANDAKMVAIDANIVLTFTEEILQAPDGTDFDGTAAKIEDVITLKDADGETVELNTVTINGGRTVVTIDPKDDLTSESVYTVYVSPVVDDRDNISDEITVTFTTKDMTDPDVKMWDPAFDTTFNPKTGVVTVTFTEAVYDEATLTGEGNSVTVDVLDENIVDFFTYKVGTITRDGDDKIDSFTGTGTVAFTGTISSDRMVMTLTPAEDDLPLTSKAWYEVVLTADVVEDIADNGNVTSKTIFQIEDHVKPTAAYSPMGAIDKDGDLTITFDEDVVVGTGMIYIRNYENGEVKLTVDVTSDEVTVEDNKVTIDPTDDLPEAMNFFIAADAGTFVDATANANPWEGIATDAIETWKISTADAVAPGVIAESGLFPATGATNVPLNTDITITFDKKIMFNADALTRWVVIYNEDWTPFDVIEVNAANIDLEPITEPVLEMSRVFAINHMNLMPSSIYYVRVMKGSVTDMATPANLFAGIMDDTWSFTTEDNVAPTITAVTPEDGSEAVDAQADLVIEFDRNVLANAAGMIKVYKEMPGDELGTLVQTVDPTSDAVVIEDNIATVNLPEDLEYSTGYYVIVETGSFTNTSTSKFPLDPGIITTQGWNFTTGVDETAPVLLEWTPLAEVIADNQPILTMTFDENVQLSELGGNLTITPEGGTEASVTVALTAEMITDNVVTVEYDYTVSGGLDKNTVYFVNVDADALTDATGNAFEGVADETTWTFTTGADFATPVIEFDEKAGFLVYPNPFKDYVEVRGANKLSRIVISNVAGQRVKDIVNPDQVISTRALRSGIYFITLVKGDAVVKTERIVKR